MLFSTSSRRPGGSETRDGPPQSIRLHLRIHASNLPKQGLMKTASPDTYAVVSSIAGRSSPKLVHDNNDEEDHHYQYDDGDSHMSPYKQQEVRPEELGRTEIIYGSSHPQWTKAFTLNYEYGSESYFFVQLFRFVDATEEPVSMGNAVCEISDILGTKHNTKVKRLPQGGVVYCRIDPIQPSNEKTLFRFQFSASDLKEKGGAASMFRAKGAPDTIMEIRRQQTANHVQQWTTIYRSMPVFCDYNPTWNVGQINLAACCNGNLDLPLRFYAMSYKKGSQGQTIGMCETTLRVILKTQRDCERTELEKEQRNHGFGLVRGGVSDQSGSQSSSKNVGRLHVVLAQVINEQGLEDQSLVPYFEEEDDFPLEETTTIATMDNAYQHRPRSTSEERYFDPYAIDIASLPAPIAAPATFQDYVSIGCQIDFCVAIDYTSSNGDPRLPGTLHYQGSDSLNEYEETITSIGNAVTVYSDEFCVWGFGAKFDGETRHIFQCGSSATARGVSGIIDSYRSVFRQNLTMSGPTVFDQVLQAAAVRGKAHQSTMTKRPRYCVLLIITDGIMDERGMEETKRKLGVYSSVPLSVIFVGVGRSTDFRSMHTLCEGTNGQRNATTVVEFRQHQYDPSALGKAALRHVPNQIVEYMTQNGIQPSL